MSTTYRTTTTSTTITEAEEQAWEMAETFFDGRPFAYVASHGLQESVDTSSYSGTQTTPTVVSVDWEFREDA